MNGFLKLHIIQIKPLTETGLQQMPGLISKKMFLNNVYLFGNKTEVIP